MNRKYTAAQLAYIKRRRRMPRRDLLAAFRREFRRAGMTQPRLQDLCNRHGWAAGPRKGRFKGLSRKYSKAELAFIRRRRKMPRRELHAAFVAAFGRRDISLEKIRQLCTRNGWATDPSERRRRTKGRTKFSKAERMFLRRRQAMPRRELHAAFVEKFQRAISVDAFKALCKRLGLRTGRTGRFEKGIVPANKGRKMPYNANCARTQFKKGSRTGRAKALYKPIGSTRLSKNGYLERKVHDGLPMQSRWRAVHLLNWEAINGSLPKNHCLKCLDGDKRNTDPSNWELVPRGLLPRLNGKSGRDYDHAPEELKPTIMAVAKLEHRMREATRSGRKRAA